MKRVLMILGLSLFAGSWLAADMIDPMTDPSLWTVQNDLNASSTLTAVTDSSVQGIKLSTQFSNGQWSEMIKSFGGGNFAVPNGVLGFWYKATGGRPEYQIGLGFKSYENKNIFISNDNQWHHAFEKISDITANMAFLSNAPEIKFIIIPNTGIKTAGTIILDKLELFTNYTTPVFIRTIDEMESSSFHSGWGSYQDKANTLVLSSVPGKSGNAIMMDYKFVDGTWLALVRPLNFNLNTADFFQFKFKSTGPVNDFQVRLTDAKDSSNVSMTYGRNFNNLVGTTEQWVTLKISPRDLFFISSDSHNPDYSKNLMINQISKISFRINRKSNATSGSILLSDLEWGNTAQTADLTKGSHPIFDELMLDHNPISPDGDGWQDKVTFSYKIGQSASIKLTVYDLRGITVRQIDMGKITAGSEIPIVWDGSDGNGKTVKNGIYAFSIRASSGSDKDCINGAIGVVK